MPCYGKNRQDDPEYIAWISGVYDKKKEEPDPYTGVWEAKSDKS